jgi:hypothetical protein
MTKVRREASSVQAETLEARANISPSLFNA